jgi:hypothetical protein
VTTDASPRWLLLIHQLPPTPAYLRVKTARQLQKIGAVAAKNSVYALPNTEAAHESLTWVGREIAAGGGDYSICASSFIAGTTDQRMEALFSEARGRDFQALAAELRAQLKALGRGRRLNGAKRAAAISALARARRRFAEIAALDFFGAPDRDTAEALIATLETRVHEPVAAPVAHERAPEPRPVAATWVTRKGVHVDRIASAWLIRRFIDPQARFKFVPPQGYVPIDGEIRFDMFDAEYTHQGDLCTFEVLVRHFEIGDGAVTAIGEVVHDLDVRDGRFGRAELPGVERLITGIALTRERDEDRLALGSEVFDALHAAWRKKKP